MVCGTEYFCCRLDGDYTPDLIISEAVYPQPFNWRTFVLSKYEYIIYTAMRIHRSAPYTAGKSCITQYFKAMDSNVNYLLHKAVMIPGRRRIAAGKRDSRRHARRMMQA